MLNAYLKKKKKNRSVLICSDYINMYVFYDSFYDTNMYIFGVNNTYLESVKVSLEFKVLRLKYR